MIKIGELKETLSKFPDDYLVTAMELDDIGIIGIYDPKHEPIGCIYTDPGLTLFNGEFALAIDEYPIK